jgi:hypothetical protein
MMHVIASIGGVEVNTQFAVSTNLMCASPTSEHRAAIAKYKLSLLCVGW